MSNPFPVSIKSLPDLVLLAALFAGLILCLRGLSWGIAESWNPDQMVFYSIMQNGEFNLHPGHFLKPPFHTYFSLALARVPAYVVSLMLGFSAIELQWLSLIWARLLTVSLFLLQICLVYSVTKSFFGLLSARMVAVIYATSAGLIGYSHFLTADIPVTTWALASFYFAERVRRSGEALDYTAAGVFAGLAAATNRPLMKAVFEARA